jgi:hypothetical protein
MYELNCHGAFAYGRGNTLDRPGANVTGGEYATTAGLE